MTPRLILASSSPRRRDLLDQIGVTPAAVRSPDIDEVPRKGELPRPYAERMASEKALAVPREEGEVVLAGDTVVALGRRILPKAGDEAEVARLLRLLSGRRHRVYSAISVIDTKENQRTRTAASQVRFKRLSDEEIGDVAAYVIDQANGDKWEVAIAKNPVGGAYLNAPMLFSSVAVPTFPPVRFPANVPS